MVKLVLQNKQICILKSHKFASSTKNTVIKSPETCSHFYSKSFGDTKYFQKTTLLWIFFYDKCEINVISKLTIMKHVKTVQKKQTWHWLISPQLSRMNAFKRTFCYIFLYVILVLHVFHNIEPFFFYVLVLLVQMFLFLFTVVRLVVDTYLLDFLR